MAMSDSDFMKMMGLTEDPVSTIPTNESTINNQNIDLTSTGASSQDVDVMKRLLERFTDTVEEAAEVSVYNPDTTEDIGRMVLSESNKGKIWQIEEDRTGKRKEYKIFNNTTGNFYDNVYLMESANKICKLLEQDHALNSKSIQAILYYDIVYRTNYDDCINLKRLHKSATLKENFTKANIMSDKFSVAKERAISAKNSIKLL